MTVRINKSAFNIREKLSELERPIGLKGSELMRSETAQEAGALLGIGRKNLCINGNFKIWQRGTSIAGGAAGNSSAGYKYVTADRFQTYYHNSYARQDSVLPNGEKVYSLRETLYSSRLYFDHVIEDGGRIFNQGDYITISFWAKTSGKRSGVSLGFYWHSGSNFAATTYTFAGVRKNVIIESSEWKYYTVTARLPANADDRPHLAIEFDNAASYGPTYGGSWVQLSTNEWWEFANIQIEKGKVATEFEHRSYGEELALCQRYFFVFDNGRIITTSNSSSIIAGSIFYPVTMRSNPSVTYYGGNSTSGTVRFYSAGSGSQLNYDDTANNLTTAFNSLNILGFNSSNISIPNGYSAWSDLGTGTNQLKITGSAEL